MNGTEIVSRWQYGGTPTHERLARLIDIEIDRLREEIERHRTATLQNSDVIQDQIKQMQEYEAEIARLSKQNAGLLAVYEKNREKEQEIAQLKAELAETERERDEVEENYRLASAERGHAQQQLAEANTWATCLCSEHRQPSPLCRVCNPEIARVRTIAIEVAECAQKRDAEIERLRAQLNANCLERDALQIELAEAVKERAGYGDTMTSKLGTLEAELAAMKAAWQDSADIGHERVVGLERALAETINNNAGMALTHAKLLDKLAEAKAAIQYFFSPGPGLAIPEPYESPVRRTELTWNEKLRRLKAVVEVKP